MKRSQPAPDAADESPASLDPVTRGQIDARAHELALISGRTSFEVSPQDYEQAEIEVMGASEMDQQDAVLAAIPEEKRGDPVPGSEQHQMAEAASDDEDDEGRSASEQLVERGVEDAERDQVLQAAIEAAKGEQ